MKLNKPCKVCRKDDWIIRKDKVMCSYCGNFENYQEPVDDLSLIKDIDEMIYQKCMVCGFPCDGKIIVRLPEIQEPLIVCGDCLNNFGNQEYNKLSKKLDTKFSRGL